VFGIAIQEEIQNGGSAALLLIERRSARKNLERVRRAIGLVFRLNSALDEAGNRGNPMLRGRIREMRSTSSALDPTMRVCEASTPSRTMCALLAALDGVAGRPSIAAFDVIWPGRADELSSPSTQGRRSTELTAAVIWAR
jgi:hypothetical protein